MPETLAESPVYQALMAVKPPELTLNAWAVKAGINRSMFNAIRRHGNPTSDTLRKLLGAIDVGMGEFEARLRPEGEASHGLMIEGPAPGRVLSEVRSAGMSQEEVRDARGRVDAPRIPLVGSAIGGHIEGIDEHVELTELHMAEALDYLLRPAHLLLDPEAYAVTIVGDSMAPRFEPGERVLVSPRASAALGDDVIVQLRSQPAKDVDPAYADRVTMVLIKRLVRRNAREIELRQFNPDTTFTIPRERVAAVHKVMPRV